LAGVLLLSTTSQAVSASTMVATLEKPVIRRMVIMAVPWVQHFSTGSKVRKGKEKAILAGGDAHSRLTSGASAPSTSQS
jgi:hypothetical protein